MDTIGQIAACACGIGIALTLAELAAPSKLFLKQLRLLFSLLLGIGILLPLAGGKISPADALDAASAADVDASRMVNFADAALQNEAAERLREVLVARLADAGISCAYLEPVVHISEEGSISISEVRLSCPDNVAASALLHELLGEQVIVTEETEGA